MHRLSSYRIHQSLVGKGSLTIEEYWPMWSDKKEQSKVVRMSWGDTPEERRSEIERVMKAGNPNWKPKSAKVKTK